MFYNEKGPQHHKDDDKVIETKQAEALEETLGDEATKVSHIHQALPKKKGEKVDLAEQPKVATFIAVVAKQNADHYFCYASHCIFSPYELKKLEKLCYKSLKNMT